MKSLIVESLKPSRGVIVIAPVLAAMAIMAFAAPVRGDSIETALMKNAPKIMKHLEAKGYKNGGRAQVSVLSEMTVIRPTKVRPSTTTWHLAWRMP